MRNFDRLIAAALVLAALAMPCPAGAGMVAVESSDPHHSSKSSMIRSTVEYSVPQVKLVRADGKTVSLPDELNDGRPVIMNFIFTTCTTICPVMTQTFARLQDMLGAERNKVHLVSISIDPEEDTPARLTEYARRLHAGPEWQYYTGTVQAIIATARAFDAYRGDKMGHTPLTLFRTAPGKPWVRIDGFATAEELLQEFGGQSPLSPNDAR